MDLSNIRIKKSIVHILNSENDNLILSNNEIQYDLDFQEYLKSHIKRIMEGDDARSCEFRENSTVLNIIKTQENFIKMSQLISKDLFTHMKQHVNIPSGNFIILEFEYQSSRWLAFLKINYISTYTYETEESKFGEINKVVNYSNAFPKSKTTKLKEAALINLENFSVRVLEKKFEVNGIRANYFSGLYLKCKGELPTKTNIKIIKNTLDLVRDKYLVDAAEKSRNSLGFKAILMEQFEEKGFLDTNQLAEILFNTKEEAKKEFIERLSKFNLNESKIIPINNETIEKICTHKVITNLGIEIKIPINNANYSNVDFISEENGSMTIVISNIESVKNY